MVPLQDAHDCRLAMSTFENRLLLTSMSTSKSPNVEIFRKSKFSWITLPLVATASKTRLTWNQNHTEATVNYHLDYVINLSEFQDTSYSVYHVMRLRLRQCFSTGVPRNPWVPWACIKGFAAILIVPKVPIFYMFSNFSVHFSWKNCQTRH
jgi:hypothetical protein